MSVPQAAVAAGPIVRAGDGTRLATWDLGGIGPPLLFLHATGFHGRCYAPMAAALGAHFHCYAADLRGHGASDLSPGGYEWSRFRDDLLAVADQLGLDRPFAFGHSMGGCLALLAEAERPGLLSGIFAYEPIVFTPEQVRASDGNRDIVERTLRRRARFPSKGAAVFNYASKPPFARFRADALWWYVEGGFDPLPDATVALHCSPDHEARVYEEATRSGAFERLGAVKAPVTLVYGGAEGEMGVDHETGITDRLAQATVASVPGLGHFGPFEDPDEVAARVAVALLAGDGGRRPVPLPMRRQVVQGQG